jgi:GNAT superfamily N-acetyltransferase
MQDTNFVIKLQEALDQVNWEISHPKDAQTYDQAVKLSVNEFVGLEQDAYSWIHKISDPILSLIASVNGDIIGSYLLGRRQILDGLREEGVPFTFYEDLSRYTNKTGIEGVALAVKPEWRGRGIGRDLISASESVRADYIWGMAYKHLANVKHWTKRRRLVAESDEIFVTLKDL